MGLQRKFTASCRIYRFRAQFFREEAGAWDTLAALIPMSAYRIPQATGNTGVGGVNGGWIASARKRFTPLLVSQPESAPTASVSRIHRAYGIQDFFFMDNHPLSEYAGAEPGIPTAFTKWRVLFQMLRHRMFHTSAQ